jgi:glycosyltransferase involved in cell wall biosynthesis
MTFTLIIPTKNRAVLCYAAIKSAEQSFNKAKCKYEIIVCIDGDDISYKKLIKEYANKINIKFIILGNIDNGSIVRNAGITLAKNEWILFLDDDDELNIDRIHDLQNFIFNSFETPSVILSPVQLVENGKNTYLSNNLNNFDFNKNINEFGRWQINGVCVARKIAQNIKFDERLLKWQDTKFVIDITEKYSPHILKKVAAYWNQNTINSVMQNKNKDGIERDLHSFLILTMDLKKRKLFKKKTYFKYLLRLSFVILRCCKFTGITNTYKILNNTYKLIK